MEPLLTSAQMQGADRFTIEHLGIPELVLMEHAALAVVKALTVRFGSSLKSSRGLIVAGPGNNGGDALAVARMLHDAKISVVQLGRPEDLSPSCALQVKILTAMGIKIESNLTSAAMDCDWVIDGIFGTGLKRPVEGKFREAIERISQGGSRWTIAIDIPSGLSADSGNPMGAAVKANQTVTLGFMKRGLVTGRAAEFTGQVELATIQIPRKIEGLVPGAFLFDRMDAKSALPPRSPVGHKGTYGHVYVWAGRPETQGACIITTTAALRAGSGLVSLFGTPDVLDVIRTRLLPEVMTQAYGPDYFTKDKSVFAVGPGMGTQAPAWELLRQALTKAERLVVDADGINLLAEHVKEARPLCLERKIPMLITPHPKEASRLLQTSVEEIERDRFQAARAIAANWNAWVLLKGKGTLIAGPGDEKIWIVNRGNSVLSKGGSGDLLTGIVASLYGQNLSPQVALALAAYVHGRAAEWVTDSRGEERTGVATDVADKFSSVFSELESA